MLQPTGKVRGLELALIASVLQRAREIIGDRERWSSEISNYDADRNSVGIQSTRAVRFTMEGALYQAVRERHIRRAYAVCARTVLIECVRRPRSIREAFGKLNVHGSEMLSWCNTHHSHDEILATFSRALQKVNERGSGVWHFPPPPRKKRSEMKKFACA